MFSYEFYEIFKNIFFKRAPLVAASANCEVILSMTLPLQTLQTSELVTHNVHLI